MATVKDSTGKDHLREGTQDTGTVQSLKGYTRVRERVTFHKLLLHTV